MSQRTMKRPHPAWIRILPACCILVFLTLGFGNNVTGLFLQSISSDIGLSYGQLSVSITIQGVITLFAIMVVGRCFAHFSIQAVTSTAIVLIAACYLLLAGGSTVYHWWIASAVIAFASAFVSIFAVSLILSEWFYQSYSLALGICTAFSGLSGAILNPLVNTLIQSFGWRTAYVVNAGTILLIGLPVTLFLLRLRPSDLQTTPYGEKVYSTAASSSSNIHPSLKDFLKDPQFYLILIGAIAVSTFYMINQHIVSINAYMELPVSVGVRAVTIQMLAITVFRVLGNFWLDRVGSAKVCCTYFLAGAVSMLLLLFVSKMSPLLFYLSVLLYGVGASVLLTIVPIWVRSAFGIQNYGKIYPLYYNLFSVIMALGGSFSGVLYENTGSYQPVFFIILIGFVSAAVCAVVLEILQIRKKSVQP